ncbi:hypothetical protein ASC95_16610 [Pelomonas sp. Root1217]|uniref:hypothetical protein n=1 Tax=Pelomonas sp. Root1217 TaxID=1736430 RepID=UPI00070F679E|nr:hypothetical protein [Pelomonas sp. Root1217]KQV49244.1 hypothetical protein ASC95_16610 [Pelomonas sp. Root1217]
MAPQRKDLHSDDDDSISDEEIEAQYFPGTVPVLPGPTASALNELVFKGDEWESSSNASVVVVLPGTREQPDTAVLELARFSLTRFHEFEAIAKQVARDFCREEGSWSVSEMNFGKEASANSADLILRLHLSPRDGSAAFDYTEYIVCFKFNQLTGLREGFRISRVVIQFV